MPTLARAGPRTSRPPSRRPRSRRQLELWRGMVRAGAGDAYGMRTHLEQAIALASRAEARRPVGAKPLHAWPWKPLDSAPRRKPATRRTSCFELAERSAMECESIVAQLPGHPTWGRRRTQPSPPSPQPRAATIPGRGHCGSGLAVAALQAAHHEDSSLEIVIPVAKAMFAGGPPEAQASFAATSASFSQRPRRARSTRRCACAGFADRSGASLSASVGSLLARRGLPDRRRRCGGGPNRAPFPDIDDIDRTLRAPHDRGPLQPRDGGEGQSSRRMQSACASPSCWRGSACRTAPRRPRSRSRASRDEVPISRSRGAPDDAAGPRRSSQVHRCRQLHHPRSPRRPSTGCAAILGKAEVLDPESVDDELLRESVFACPTGAIVIDEVSDLLPWQLRGKVAPNRRVLKTFMFTDVVGLDQPRRSARRRGVGHAPALGTTRRCARCSPPTRAARSRTTGDGFLRELRLARGRDRRRDRNPTTARRPSPEAGLRAAGPDRAARVGRPAGRRQLPGQGRP